jgi:hypothetical protein
MNKLLAIIPRETWEMPKLMCQNTSTDNDNEV